VDVDGAVRGKRGARDVEAVRQPEQRRVQIRIVDDEHDRRPQRCRRRDPSGVGHVGELVGRDVGLLGAPVAHRREHDERHEDDRDRPRGPMSDPVADPDEAEPGQDGETEREREDPVGREPSGDDADGQGRGRHERPGDEEPSDEAARAIAPRDRERGRHERRVAAPVVDESVEVDVAELRPLAGTPEHRVEGRVAREARRADERREDPADDDAGASAEGGEDAPRVGAIVGRIRPRPAATSPRPRRGHDEDGRREQEELGVRQAAAAQEQRRRDGPPSRAAREGGGGREERRDEGEVRQVARAEERRPGDREDRAREPTRRHQRVLHRRDPRD